MLEVAREVRGGVWQFVGPVSDEQVVSASESRTVRLEATNSLILQRFYKRILGLISNREEEGFSLEISLEMCRVFMELILPAQRCIPSNDLVILSQTKRNGVLIRITHLMKLLNAKFMVAGAVDQLQADFIIEEGSDDIEVVDDGAGVDMRILHLKRGAAFLHLKLALACVAVYLDVVLLELFLGGFGVFLNGEVSEVALAGAEDHRLGQRGGFLALVSGEFHAEFLALFFGIRQHMI